MSKHISIEDISVLDEQVRSQSKYRVIQGVLHTNHASNINTNFNVANRVSHSFNHVIPKLGGVTDQKNSGRCWIFAGLNLIRHKMIDHYKLDLNFELSQTYTYRCDKLERCNTAMELMFYLIKQKDGVHGVDYGTIIPVIIDDGGTWKMFQRLITKYGVMPKELYPDGKQAVSTFKMNQLLRITVMRQSVKLNSKTTRDEFVILKKKTLEKCHRIISLCLGNSPVTFKAGHLSRGVYDTKKEVDYTPIQYYNQIVKKIVNVNDYINVCNYPQVPFNTVIGVELLHNVLEENEDVSKDIGCTYYNMRMEDMKAAIFKSIKKKTGVWFACHYGRFLQNSNSLLDTNASNLEDIFDVDITIDKKDGMLARVIVPSHAMLIVGCDHRDKVTSKWKVENSHGSDNKHNGYVTMTDKWLDTYGICAAIHKSCLKPSHLKKITESKNRSNMHVLPYYSVLGTFAD